MEANFDERKQWLRELPVTSDCLGMNLALALDNFGQVSLFLTNIKRLIIVPYHKIVFEN